MLDKDNPDVLAYVRTTPKGISPVVVAVNMSAEPKTVLIDLASLGIRIKSMRTLAASVPSLMNTTSFDSVVLPPFSSWVVAVRAQHQ